MRYFFDTSALVKLFHEEDGSIFVENIVNSIFNEIWILDLSCVEFLSCIHRLYRQRDINDEELSDISYAFYEQLNSFIVKNVNASIINEAETLLKKFGKNHSLKTLDSIQLGAVVQLNEKDINFICADKKLCDVAILNGINVFVPTDI